MAGSFISSKYLVLSNSLAATQNQPGFSMAMWVRPATVSATERFLMCFTINGSTTSVRAGLSTYGTGTPYVYRVSSRRLDADSLSTVDSTTAPVAGNLVHLCGTYGWTTGEMTVYVNGVQENSISIPAWNGNSSNTVAGGGTVCVRPDHTSLTLSNAYIDDLRLYQRELTATEVQIITTARGRDSVVNGLFDRWKLMDGATSSIISTTASIGSNQGVATSQGSPTYYNALFTVTRKRRR